MLQLILFYVYFIIWCISMEHCTFRVLGCYSQRDKLLGMKMMTCGCYWYGNNQIVWHTFYHTFRCVKIIAAKVKGAEILVAVAKKRK